VNTICNSSLFRFSLGNRGGLVSGGMKIAGPIAVCSADPPLDRWNGWGQLSAVIGDDEAGFFAYNPLRNP
jgi:hypothetical protein